jgi:hypothetical protein
LDSLSHFEEISVVSKRLLVLVIVLLLCHSLAIHLGRERELCEGFPFTTTPQGRSTDVLAEGKNIQNKNFYIPETIE